MDKILVTGSNGQLGSELRDLASLFAHYEFVFFSRDQLPINDKKRADEVFQQLQPNYLINCAAYTAVDKAEEEHDLATDINGKAVGHLAFLCRKYNTRFIHISTDYVFNGNAAKPLTEKDEVDPVNAYGASKLLGEYLAEKNDPECIIIRTSWVYSSYGKNFLKTMIRLMRDRQSISVVNDQKGSPTYAADLANAIMQIIGSGNWKPGIYNFSNDGIITWFEFAKEIALQTASPCEVLSITTEQFPTPAKRPAYSVLDKTKIQQTYAVRIKDWKASLQDCIKKLNAIS